MTNGFLIIGSNDVGFQDLEVLQQLGLNAASAELGYSGGSVRKLYDENFDVRLTLSELKQRRFYKDAT